jgi:hypothetical protein
MSFFVSTERVGARGTRARRARGRGRCRRASGRCRAPSPRSRAGRRRRGRARSTQRLAGMSGLPGWKPMRPRAVARACRCSRRRRCRARCPIMCMCASNSSRSGMPSPSESTSRGSGRSGQRLRLRDGEVGHAEGPGHRGVVDVEEVDLLARGEVAVEAVAGLGHLLQDVLGACLLLVTGEVRVIEQVADRLGQAVDEEEGRVHADLAHPVVGAQVHDLAHLLEDIGLAVVGAAGRGHRGIPVLHLLAEVLVGVEVVTPLIAGDVAPVVDHDAEIDRVVAAALFADRIRRAIGEENHDVLGATALHGVGVEHVLLEHLVGRGEGALIVGRDLGFHQRRQAGLDVALFVGEALGGTTVDLDPAVERDDREGDDGVIAEALDHLLDRLTATRVVGVGARRRALGGGQRGVGRAAREAGCPRITGLVRRIGELHRSGGVDDEHHLDRKDLLGWWQGADLALEAEQVVDEAVFLGVGRLQRGIGARPGGKTESGDDQGPRRPAARRSGRQQT